MLGSSITSMKWFNASSVSIVTSSCFRIVLILFSASSIDPRKADEECSAVDRRPKPVMETGSLACSHAFSSRLLPRRRPSASQISPSKRFQTDKLDDEVEVVRIRYVIFGIEKHDLKRTYSKCPSSKLDRVSRMVLTLSTLSVFIALKSSFPIGAPRYDV